jgi:transposase
MSDKDFRDACAMLAMCGLIMNRGIIERIPELSYAIADEMLKERNPSESGITAIKRKVKVK